jgi:hypothetical protein
LRFDQSLTPIIVKANICLPPIPGTLIVPRYDLLDPRRQPGFLQNDRVDQNALIRNQIPRAPASSASALFAAIAFLTTALASSSAFGGNSGRSLYGLSESKTSTCFVD